MLMLTSTTSITLNSTDNILLTLTYVTLPLSYKTVSPVEASSCSRLPVLVMERVSEAFKTASFAEGNPCSTWLELAKGRVFEVVTDDAVDLVHNIVEDSIKD